MEIEEYKGIIKNILSTKRYTHCVNVAKSAKKLAKKYGVDPYKAEVCGMLHDITKETRGIVQLELISKYGIALDSVEKITEKLWHAASGAVYVENVLGIKDKEILTAIRYHTTGRAGMSLLEKIVYIADFISVEREYEGVEKIRQAAKISLEKAMKVATEFSLQYLLKTGSLVDVNTVGAYNEAILSFK